MADREQKQVIKSIIRIGQRRRMPRQAILSALATGSVESHFRNLSGGDRDSAGWRQERGQYYRNPTNVKAAVNRYYDEWEHDAKGRGLSIGGQAQAVQQSGFPGRYNTRLPTAKRLLARYGGASSSQTRSNVRTVTRRTPGVDNGPLRDQLKQQYLLERGDPDALLNLGLGLQGADDVPGSVSTTTRRTRTQTRRGDPAAGGGSPVHAMLQRAVGWEKAKVPYLWGGGHGSIARPGQSVDCSGFVSAVLGLKTPLVSGQLKSWGKPGPGKHVTVYASDSHTFIRIGNRWFGTSASNPGGGAGRIPPPSASYLAGFVQRHP